MESFEQVISEHLELKTHNRRLEETIPLARYRSEVVGVDRAPRTSDAEALEDKTGSVDGWPLAEWETGTYAPDLFWTAAPAFGWAD